MQGFMILASIGIKKDTLVFDVEFCQSQWSIQCRSRVPGHGACL